MVLAEIQSKLKCPKSLYNSFGKYHYRSAEDILEAVKALVNPMGYYVTINDEIVPIGNRYYVKATVTLTNGQETYSATSFAREEDDKKGMDGSQITGAASSYARKYALNALFAIDDNADSDKTNTHDDKKKKLTLLTEDKIAKAVEYMKANNKTVADMRNFYEISPEIEKKINAAS